MSVITLISEKIQSFSSAFTADYYEAEFGTERRFPSFVTAAFRFVLRYVLYVVPVIWIGMVILCLVRQLPFMGALAAGLAFTALILAGIFLVFLLAMAMESYARIFTCLILYGELPKGAENPVDALITYALVGLQ